MNDPGHPITDQPPGGSGTITLADAARTSGLNRKTIKAAVDRGEIRAYRRQEAGSSPYLLNRDDFDEWFRGRPVLTPRDVSPRLAGVRALYADPDTSGATELPKENE